MKIIKKVLKIVGIIFLVQLILGSIIVGCSTLSKSTDSTKIKNDSTHQVIESKNYNSSGSTYVKGYYRKDGTYVKPHTRKKRK